MPIVVVTVMMAVMAMLSSLIAQTRAQAQVNRLAVVETAQAVVFEAAREYMIEYGQAPATLSQLASHPDYTHVKGYMTYREGGFWPSTKSLIHLQGVNGLSASGVRVSRVGVIGPADASLSTEELFSAAHNNCRTSSGSVLAFEAGDLWCGHTGSVWSVADSRSTRTAHDAWAMTRMNDVAEKFKRKYSNPAVTAVAVPRTDLRSVVTPSTGSSVGSELKNCTGTFHYQLIPFGCEDLYTAGGPIQFQLTVAKQLTLYTNSVAKTPSGGTILLTTSKRLTS